jgi:hypothetical protein
MNAMSNTPSAADKLKELQGLHEAGLINDEELAQRRTAILDAIAEAPSPPTPEPEPEPAPPAAPEAPEPSPEPEPRTPGRWTAEEKAAYMDGRSTAGATGANNPTFIIREAGKNGTIQVFDDRLERTLKNRITKNDQQIFPLKNVTSVHQDRKMMRTDKVKVVIGIETYEWKVKNAEAFVSLVNEKIIAL